MASIPNIIILNSIIIRNESPKERQNKCFFTVLNFLYNVCHDILRITCDERLSGFKLVSITSAILIDFFLNCELII